MAVRHDLRKSIWRGDTFSQPFRFKDANGPMSLEGKTVVFTLKLDPSALDEEADLIYEVDIPNPDTVAAEGDHTIVLQRSETATLQLATYNYQLKVISPSSPEDIEITYLHGRVPVEDS